MTEGWIKLHRRITQWEWYTHSETLHLFLHLVLNANHKDRQWRGIEVKRGQIIVGRRKLSHDTGLSEQSIRTSLKRLKSTHELTTKSTNQHSLITICNYDTYNNNDILSTSNSTSKRPTINQQLTTNKNVKNEKKKEKTYVEDSIEFQLACFLYEKISERKKDFKKPNFQNWARDVDLMIRRDSRPPERIKEIIKWCQADEGNENWKGWQDNILSTSKLRKQYDKLDLAMKKAKPVENKKCLVCDSVDTKKASAGGQMIRLCAKCRSFLNNVAWGYMTPAQIEKTILEKKTLTTKRDSVIINEDFELNDNKNEQIRKLLNEN